MKNRVYPLPVSHEALFSGKRGEQIPYHRMYGKEYCVSAVIYYAEKEVELLRKASVEVDQIYQKVLRLVQRVLPDPVLINQLAVHPALIPAARMEVPFHGISRQDWILLPEGPKLIENNTDTPTGIPETSFLAGSILKDFTTSIDPSKSMNDSIRSAFARLIDFYRECGLTGEIAFTCYEWHGEDVRNTRYLMEQVQEAGYPAWFAPLEELEIQRDRGLFHNGKKIDILYRLYPLEYLVHDTDEDGFPTGEAILSLVEQKKLALINPTQSIISQSKGFLALIWSLYEKNDWLSTMWGLKSAFFSPEECDTIHRFLLPAYFEDQPFRKSGTPWVSKVLFGREGKGTVLYTADGYPETVPFEHNADHEEDLATKTYYSEQPRIYQRRVAMERVCVPTETGPFDGFLLTGAFIIGGSFAGLLPRIGGQVTGNMAYFAPAAIQRDNNPKEQIKEDTDV